MKTPGTSDPPASTLEELRAAIDQADRNVEMGRFTDHAPESMPDLARTIKDRARRRSENGKPKDP